MLVQHLSVGSVLQGVACQYMIKKVLGQGTFGITYLATTELEGPLGRLPVNVALKEFFVKDLNGRSEDGSVREDLPIASSADMAKLFSGSRSIFRT